MGRTIFDKKLVANKNHTYKNLINHDNSYYLELVLVAQIPIAMPSIQKWKMVYMSVPSGRILFFVKLLELLLLGTPGNNNLQKSIMSRI